MSSLARERISELVLSQNKSSITKVYLTTLFSTSSASGRDANASLATGCITTRVLKGHTPVFNDIVKTSKDEIMNFLQETYKNAYLVVGTKTCRDASLVSTDATSKGNRVAAKAPVTQIVSYAAGAPNVSGIVTALLPSTVTPPQQQESQIEGTLTTFESTTQGSAVSSLPITGQPLDVAIDHDKKQAATHTANFTATGERLFAIQCRKVQLKAAWFSDQKSMKLSAAYIVFKDRGMYGAVDDSEGEDEDEDEDEETGGSDENVKLGSGEQEKTKIGGVVFGAF